MMMILVLQVPGYVVRVTFDIDTVWVETQMTNTWDNNETCRNVYLGISHISLIKGAYHTLLCSPASSILEFGIY